jgi:FkbM family methyltransferase
MKNKIIFDVGAYDGIDGLALAIKNPKCTVYAFEANPVLFEKINYNKLKIEKRIGKRVSNYKAINKAVSNIDKQGDFLISKNPTSSSLKEF